MELTLYVYVVLPMDASRKPKCYRIVNQRKRKRKGSMSGTLVLALQWGLFCAVTRAALVERKTAFQAGSTG